MDKQTLKIKLHESHNTFISYLDRLSEDAFLSRKNDKWTAGQQLEHIVRAVKPVRQVLSAPKFLLKSIWGKANRESRTYTDLVNKYHVKLAAGGRAAGRFVPKAVSVEKGSRLKVRLKNEVDKLAAKLDKFSEHELDTYILPHPLLGKLTIREMIYFTIYHVEHHQNNTKQNLV